MARPNDMQVLNALRDIRDAAYHLVEDVKRRHPGEELTCPYMRALDRTLRDWEELALLG